jgi:cell wall-associated NlpC family hydrolase
VQRSAYPDAYAKHVGLIRQMWPKIVHAGGGTVTSMDGPSDIPVKTFGPIGGSDSLASGSGRGPTIGSLDSYNSGMDLKPLPDPNVLGAQWSDVLAAPQFLVQSDPYQGEQPTYQSFLGDHTFREVKDKASAEGNWQPTKGVDGWRAAVVEFARKQVGKPYAWGVSDPNRGFDCSGLVQFAFSRAGIQMPRVSYQQANSGQRVALNTLRPGDLVAWDNSSRNNGADHIAIYIGNGQIIEAPRPGIGVRIRKLGHNEGAWGVRVSR